MELSKSAKMTKTKQGEPLSSHNPDADLEFSINLSMPSTISSGITLDTHFDQGYFQ